MDKVLVECERKISNFTMIPNIVDDMDLDPYSFRLYVHLRRVSGENGACWQSTRTLADKCKMSTGKVVECKKELEECGLIVVEEKEHPEHGKYHVITIVDIWTENAKKYDQSSRDEQGGVHVVNGGVHVVIHKNNPINNNPIKSKEFVSKPKPEKVQKKYSMSNEEVITDIISNSDKAKSKQGVADIPEIYQDYAKAFIEGTGIRYIKKYFGDWVGTFSDWMTLGYSHVDVRNAIDAIIDNGNYAISRPGSIDWKLRSMQVRKKEKDTDPYKNFKVLEVDSD